MKNNKRFISFVLMTVVLATSLLTTPVFATNGDMRYGRTKLSADLQVIYDALVSGCASAEAKIGIDIRGRNIDFDKDLKTVYTMFYSDYPEYFWVTGGWNAQYNEDTLIMKPHYSIPGGDLNAAKAKYNAKVKEMISGISGSDYQKAKTLHDRLIDRVVYTKTANDQNAYGALVEGKAICNGYARAYQHLMSIVGIPAWYVLGESINPATNTPIAHAWNLVKLDGAWCYVDVTWDDQGDKTFYTYFNITTQQLLKDHSFHTDYAALVPQATSTGANYYKREAREFAGYDQNKLVNLLKKDGNRTQIYVDGDVNAFIASINANMLPIGEQLGGAGAFQVFYNYYRLGNALILDFVLISEGGHTHKPKTFVQQVEASCLTNGKKAYYICDCGMLFSDEACTKQIVDDNALTIPATAHTPTGYKNDGAKHWKECAACGCEIANSSGGHYDRNGDNKCDICAYTLPVVNVGGDATGGDSTGNGNATDTTTAGDTDTTSKPDTSTDNTTDSTAETTDEPAEDNMSIQPTDDETPTDGSEAPSGDSETGTDEGTTPVTEATASQDSVQPDGSVLGWVWICLGVVVAAAGASVTVILLRKKKT